jgi:hypothetical protein
MIADVRHAWPCHCAVHAVRKKLKLSSNGGNSGSKKCKRGYGGAYGGVWRSLESGCLFCVGAFARNPASVASNMLSHLISFLRHFINFVLSVRFAKITLQQTVLLFSTRRFILVILRQDIYICECVCVLTLNYLNFVSFMLSSLA